MYCPGTLVSTRYTRPRLPVAAARQVIRSLLNGGQAEEVPAPIDDAGYVWRTDEDGDVLMLQATMLGLAGVTADALRKHSVPSLTTSS